MPAGKKVRTGCARCKKKRLKCDETRPGCQRCTRLNQICPGYNPPLRWSTKHEVSKTVSSQEQPRQDGQINFHSEDALSENTHNCQDTIATLSGNAAALAELPGETYSVTPNQLDFSLLSPLFDVMPLYEIGSGNTTQDILDDFELSQHFRTDDFDSPLLDIDNVTSTIEPPQESLSSTHFTCTRPTIPSSHTLTFLQQNPKPTWPVTSRGDDFLVEYYFKEVAIIYSCYDGEKNPFRTAIASMWTSSELVTKTLKSMAAACLAPEYPYLSREGIRFRDEVLADLDNTPATEHPVDVTLLVTIMLGQTAGWHNPKDLGMTCYHRSKALLELLESQTVDTSQTFFGRDVSFFRNAIEYWEMPLAFVSGKRESRLSALYPRDDLFSSSTIEPHPWALVAPAMLQIIRQVGELVWENRTSSRNRRFWQSSDLTSIQESIDRGSNLERQLLDYNLPSADVVFDTRDETTPVVHLLTICQAYRLVALIQIYRVFPDVLIARIQSQRQQEGHIDSLLHRPSSNVSISELDRENWLRKSAMQALNLVKSIPLESHTRCVQPFLLIALSSEIGSLHMGSSEGLMLSTVQARRFIKGRLESFRLLLPPKPAQCRLDLVLQIWDYIDSGEKNVYWLDVVIEKEWHFLFG